MPYGKNDFVEGSKILLDIDLRIIYVTYTIDKCAHVRETECISWLLQQLLLMLALVRMHTIIFHI